MSDDTFDQGSDCGPGPGPEPKAAEERLAADRGPGPKAAEDRLAADCGPGPDRSDAKADGEDRLVVDCRPLIDGPDRFLAVRRALAVDGAASSAARVRGGAVDLDLRVEAASGGFVVRGRIGGAWAGGCRRCLEEVGGSLDAPVREVFEDSPAEGETWPVADDRIDLAPMVREAAILALPLAPLCSPDCSGPEPDRFPTGPAASALVPDPGGRDPRWAALDQIAFDS